MTNADRGLERRTRLRFTLVIWGELVNRQGGKTADAQLKCSSPDTCRRNHPVS
jgi:hypothetical protein